MNNGFTLGTWDLLHFGHADFIRRARLQCSYLTVGVLVPEVLEVLGKPAPIMSIPERCEMLRRLRSVDQVVPVSVPDLVTLQYAYSFRYLFVGEDWRGKLTDADRLERETPARVVYLPRTEGISTSEIRERVIKAHFAAGRRAVTPAVRLTDHGRAVLNEGAPILPRAVGGAHALQVRACRVCGCTDTDCSDCVQRTGQPCHWVGENLCSACADATVVPGETDFRVITPLPGTADEVAGLSICETCRALPCVCS